MEWNLNQVTGYLRSWSAYQKYVDDKNSDPLLLIESDLLKAWGDPANKKQVVWELHWLLGRKILP